MSDETAIAQTGPYQVELTKDQEYWVPPLWPLEVSAVLRWLAIFKDTSFKPICPCRVCVRVHSVSAVFSRPTPSYDGTHTAPLGGRNYKHAGMS